MNKFKHLAIVLLGVILLKGTLHLEAQTVKPEHSTIFYQNKLADCLVVSLDPEPETLKKAWRDHLKEQYDFKLKGIGLLRSDDVLTAEEVVIQQVSSNSIDFLTRIVEDENGSEMKVFASFGYDAYISKKDNEEEFGAIQDMIEDFLTTYLPVYYSGEISDTKQRVKELMQEQADLEEEITEGKAEIESLEKEITELKERESKNLESLEIAKQKLKKRKEKMEKINLKLKKL